MNLENVMLVRAMSHVPLNGELIPTCEASRLVADHQSEFFYFMQQCVKDEIKREQGRDLMLYFDSPDTKLVDQMMQDYAVLTGDYYTTTLSFSLNGMVPDDINNNFTDMKVAVLEPLKNQTNADFVTIDAIDTTVKGRMTVSDEAKLVIDRELFNSLSQEEQENLIEHYEVKPFEGELREAVDNELKNAGYPSLPLIQKRDVKNIEECPEREGMLEFEDKFAAAVGASRASLQNLTFMFGGGSEVDQKAHDKLSEEHPNTLTVQQHYKNQLYEFLINKAESIGIAVSEEEKFYMFSDYSAGEDAMKRVTSALIEQYGGMQNFKAFIQEYNQYVRDNYLTNQQIVALSENKNKS